MAFDSATADISTTPPPPVARSGCCFAVLAFDSMDFLVFVTGRSQHKQAKLFRQSPFSWFIVAFFANHEQAIMLSNRLQDTALRYFLEVVRSGSVSEAATRLNVSPSAVSRQVAGLEEMLGVPLFERRPRGMAPSPADRKSTRLNSSHSQISYAVFCLKKKKNIKC